MDTTNPNAITERQSFTAMQLKPEERQHLIDAYKGKTSDAGAIKAQCLVCKKGVRQDIQDCKIKMCPLNRYRPWKTGRTTDDGLRPPRR